MMARRRERHRVIPTRMFARMAVDRRQVTEASVLASTFSGLPSTLDAFVKHRSLRSAVIHVYETTRAVGTLLPPGRPDFTRGAVVHLAISMVCGETLARTLPRDHSVAWGAAAGFVIGVLNVGVIGRSFPAIRRLPLVPQLADNVMFGMVFALVLDRRDRQPGDHARIQCWSCRDDGL
jgi:hypothetical protein